MVSWYQLDITKLFSFCCCMARPLPDYRNSFFFKCTKISSLFPCAFCFLDAIDHNSLHFIYGRTFPLRTSWSSVILQTRRLLTRKWNKPMLSHAFSYSRHLKYLNQPLPQFLLHRALSRLMSKLHLFCRRIVVSPQFPFFAQPCNRSPSRSRLVGSSSSL